MLNRAWITGLCVLLLTAPARTAEPEGKIVHEAWDAAYLDDGKAGFVHTVVREIDRDGQKLYKATTELNLKLQRFEQTINLRMETGSVETAAGKVTAVAMTQSLGKNQDRLLTGIVKDNELNVTVDEIQGDMRKRVLERKLPWNEKVVGLYKQDSLLRDKKAKPGDQFSYMAYEPTINAVVTTAVHVKDMEEVDLRGKKEMLLRVEAVPGKIDVGNAAFQLPTLISWVDKELVTRKSRVEVPGLGVLMLYRSTKEDAQGAGPIAQIKDIGISQLVKLNRRIERPYDTRNATYRITIKGDEDPKSAFARDGRQSIKNVQGNQFDLHVVAQLAPKIIDNPGEAAAEFLKSNNYVNSDDERVKQHAKAAVGRETDAWKKALAIEQWVHKNMKNKNFTEAFATADHVAKTLEGDCTEHAMLAAAMCRAAGVPSRTAIGLVYVDSPNGPTMGFHMWTEVWVQGQWLPIDATLGRGHVGATHLKISDHSWHEVQSLAPLLPVVRVVGKVSIGVVSVNEER